MKELGVVVLAVATIVASAALVWMRGEEAAAEREMASADYLVKAVTGGGK